MAADLSIVPDELRPDDGNGDDDAYNRGWNECRARVLAALRAEAGAVGKDRPPISGEGSVWRCQSCFRVFPRGQHKECRPRPSQKD